MRKSIDAPTHNATPRVLDAPVLGNRVQIGAGAVILGAVQIGDDCRIGANAVVPIDAPQRCALIGNPARIVDASAP